MRVVSHLRQGRSSLKEGDSNRASAILMRESEELPSKGNAQPLQSLAISVMLNRQVPAVKFCLFSTALLCLSAYHKVGAELQ